MRPRRQKGRGFQKCIHTSQIISIFNQSTQHFHIFSDAKKKVEDSRNAHIHLRLNQFSITAHNIFTYDPIPQKKAEDSENACTHISDLVKFTIQYFHIFSPKSLDSGEMFKP